MSGRTKAGMFPLHLPQRPRASLLMLICLSISMSACRNGGRSSFTAVPPDAAGVHSYSTHFTRTENPISEGGFWIGGSNAGASLSQGGHFWRGGRLWGDVQTTSNFAFGVDEPTKYGDPTAILAGNWGPVQTATAVVKVRNTPDKGCCHEVELRLRTTISPLSITGYEAYCSVLPSNPYCHVARWNGPNGSYWNFETRSPEIYLRDGDVIKATVTGTNPAVITFYRNGEQIMEAVDTGAAGVGSEPSVRGLQEIPALASMTTETTIGMTSASLLSARQMIPALRLRIRLRSQSAECP